MAFILPQQPLIHNLPPAALYWDTPSRHPCKITVTSSEKRRFQYNPYKGLRAPTLNQGGDDDEESDESDDPIAAALKASAPDAVKSTAAIPMAAFSPLQKQQSPPPQAMLALPSPIGFDGVQPNSQIARFDVSAGGVGGAARGGACLVQDGGCMRMIPGTIAYANVRFKFSEAIFYVPGPERAGLAVGDYLVVQGDRGEDIGLVTSDVSALFGTDPIPGVPHVLRRALNKDRKKYFAARRKETYAAGVAADLTKEFSLNMTVLDCEFQTDLQKLTVFYRPSVDGLIDFRQLQRSLFKQFRCRIWLLNWDTEFQQRLEQHRQSILARAGHALSAAALSYVPQ